MMVYKKVVGGRNFTDLAVVPCVENVWVKAPSKILKDQIFLQ